MRVINLRVNIKRDIIESETPDLLVDQICRFQLLCDWVNSKYKSVKNQSGDIIIYHMKLTENN